MAQGPAAAAAPLSGRVDVFGTGLEGGLFRATRTGLRWSRWAPVS